MLPWGPCWCARSTLVDELLPANQFKMSVFLWYQSGIFELKNVVSSVTILWLGSPSPLSDSTVHRSLVSVAFSYSLFTFQLLSSLHATINQFLVFLTLMVLQSPMETFLKMIAIQNVAVKPISFIQFVIRPSIWPTLHHAMLVAHQLRMEFSKIASAYLAQKI